MYDETAIKETLNKIREQLPDIPARRLTDGEFLITSKWKQGDLKRVEVDHIETPLKNAATAIERILKNSNRFRPNFTGTLEFRVIINEGKSVGLHYELGNWIMHPRRERRNINGGLGQKYCGGVYGVVDSTGKAEIQSVDKFIVFDEKNKG